MRSHRPGGQRVGSTGHYEDNTTRVRQPDTGSNPTHRNWLCGPWQVFERLTGDVAFQTAHDLACGEALGPSPPHVVAGPGV